MKRIWIRAKAKAPEALRCQKALQEAFKSQGYLTVTEVSEGQSLDLCICVGGDGTVLAAVRELGPSRFSTPILAVHASWGLGFMQSIRVPDLDTSVKVTEPRELETVWAAKLVKAWQEGRYIEESRWGLESRLKSGHGSSPSQALWALNDIVINKGAISRLVSLRVSVGETLLIEKLRGDGLIVSSATGSTAYSLSAGGPILAPTLPSLVMTAICPHEVAQRPLVLDGSEILSIEVLQSKVPSFLTADGQQQIEVHPGETIQVGRAERPLRWLSLEAPELGSKSYFERLRSKLRYGAD